MKHDQYLVTFNFKKELEKSIMVQKKTKLMNKIFFIPKSVIIEQNTYTQKKNLWSDCFYTRERIGIVLPKWFCEKELGFFV
jgi:hypothetical protein